MLTAHMLATVTATEAADAAAAAAKIRQACPELADLLAQTSEALED